MWLRAQKPADASRPVPSAPAPLPNPELLVPALASLGLHSARLTRDFQRTLDYLRAIQADRRQRQRRDLVDAAAILEHHKNKGIRWEPPDHGFVFSKDQVERAEHNA